MLSTHKVEVLRVQLEKHPNADSLSIVNVFGGYPCAVRSSDWKDGELAAYIPPDSVVDTSRPEFAFLQKGVKSQHRIRCVKLRGVPSFGLLIHAPSGSDEGDDVADQLGVIHYEPEMRGLVTSGEAEQAPPSLAMVAKYDIDSLRRYASVFVPGETVHITEKIHGANARYAYVDGRMWCGSRGEWKQTGINIWWNALENHPEIALFCQHHEGYILYGEVYGRVQELRYGVPGGVRFMAFDVLSPTGQFWNADEFRSTVAKFGVPLVPLLGVIPFDFQKIVDHADGPSTVPGADHHREGVVVRPEIERWHQSIGRVALKVVGSEYLSAK